MKDSDISSLDPHNESPPSASRKNNRISSNPPSVSSKLRTVNSGPSFHRSSSKTSFREPLRRSLASFGRSLQSVFSRNSGKSDEESGWSPTSRGSSPRKEPANEESGKDIFWGQIQGRVEDKYALGEEIGRGAFGVCRRAQVLHRMAWMPKHGCMDVFHGQFLKLYAMRQDNNSHRALCCKTINKDCLSEQQLLEVKHEVSAYKRI